MAQQRNIELVDGSVEVTIECMPGQFDAAANAATKAGAKVVNIYRDLVQVVVPITSLLALTEAPGIRFIRRPVYASEE